MQIDPSDERLPRDDLDIMRERVHRHHSRVGAEGDGVSADDHEPIADLGHDRFDLGGRHRGRIGLPEREQRGRASYADGLGALPGLGGGFPGLPGM